MTNRRGRKSLSRTERRRNATARRRAKARRLQRVDPARRRRQWILRVGLGVVVVAIAAGAIFVLVNRDSGSEAQDVSLTGTVVDDEQDLTITTVPTTYHVVYRLEAEADEGPTVSTEEFTVERPFNGLVSGKDGAPPGATVQWTALSNMGVYSSATAGADAQVGKTMPSAALGDFRLDATLSDLVANGSFVPQERREVLGRECQVYRTGQALETFSVAAPTDASYSDVCIDASGLLLEEVTVSNGAVQQRLIATTVEDPYTVPDGAFTISGTPTALDAGGSELNPIDPAAAPVAGYWTLDAPPDGYTHQGRYVLRQQATPPADTADPSATTTTTVAPTIQETYVDVYVNGDKAIMVQQGPNAAAPQAQLPGATTATVGTLGSAQVASGITGTTILAKPTAPADWFVQLTGTVPVATLEAVATSMHG